MERGLNLRLVSTRPDWPIVIDPNTVGRARALKPVGDSPLILNDKTGEEGLFTTIHETAVKRIFSELSSIPTKPIATESLNPPPNTQVIHITRSMRAVSEETLFSDLFQKPFTSC